MRIQTLKPITLCMYTLQNFGAKRFRERSLPDIAFGRRISCAAHKESKSTKPIPVYPAITANEFSRRTRRCLLAKSAPRGVSSLAVSTFNLGRLPPPRFHGSRSVFVAPAIFAKSFRLQFICMCFCVYICSESGKKVNTAVNKNAEMTSEARVPVSSNYMGPSSDTSDENRKLRH
jgi:hypothetical protein